MTINLKIPSVPELNPRITVFGVGGAGGNAVNNMIASKLEGVEFVVANTDAQALAQSSAERRIQIGATLTSGLGAGSRPEIGAAAAEEAMGEIMDHISGVHMVFITGGMGGGTGTGAAPVIARAARDQGILTVGVVTKPFQFEGHGRMVTAEKGIEELSKHVDTLIVIPNQNLFRVATEKTTFADAFQMADEVLHSGVAGITDLMVKEGLINLDFADVRTVMNEMGKAMMGTGMASGEKRAIEAAEAAISNPLLDDVSMRGARGLLISITGGDDLTLYEVDEAATRIREEVDPSANIILGATFDASLDGYIRVSVVATGIDRPEHMEQGAPELAPAQIASPIVPVGLNTLAFDEDEPVQEDVAKNEIEETSPELGDWADMSDVNDGEVFSAEPIMSDVDNVLIESMADEQVVDAPMIEKQAPRMPEISDFPPIVVKEYKEHEAEAATGIPAEFKKRPNFFEKLIQVGLGKRNEDTEVVQAKSEPDFHQPAAHTPAAEMPNQSSQPVVSPPDLSSTEHHTDMDLDTEQLEIPAFLRRQAN